MAVFTSRFAGSKKKGGGGVAQRCIEGLDYLYFQVNVPIVATDSTDEQILLYKFPDDGDCWLLRDALTDLGVTPSNMDSSTGIVFQIGIGDVDGVIDTPLIADSAAAQSGALDELAAVGAPLDVSGKYLIWDTTTAVSGTASAGTVDVKCKVLFGKKLEVDSSVSA